MKYRIYRNIFYKIQCKQISNHVKTQKHERCWMQRNLIDILKILSKSIAQYHTQSSKNHKSNGKYFQNVFVLSSIFLIDVV